MNPHKVIITNWAFAQLEGISRRHVLAILDAIDLLRNTPLMYRVAGDYSRHEYRRFHVHLYRVIYRVDEGSRVVYINWIGPASTLPPLESDLEASERT